MAEHEWDPIPEPIRLITRCWGRPRRGRCTSSIPPVADFPIKPVMDIQNVVSNYEFQVAVHDCSQTVTTYRSDRPANLIRLGTDCCRAVVHPQQYPILKLADNRVQSQLADEIARFQINCSDPRHPLMGDRLPGDAGDDCAPVLAIRNRSPREILSPLAPVLWGEGLGVRGKRVAGGEPDFLDLADKTSFEQRGGMTLAPPHPRPHSPGYRGEGSKVIFRRRFRSQTSPTAVPESAGS